MAVAMLTPARARASARVREKTFRFCMMAGVRRWWEALWRGFEEEAVLA